MLLNNDYFFLLINLFLYEQKICLPAKAVDTIWGIIIILLLKLKCGLSQTRLSSNCFWQPSRTVRFVCLNCINLFYTRSDYNKASQNILY